MDRHAEEARRLLKKRKACGLCPTCGGTPADGLSRCKKCNSQSVAKGKVYTTMRAKKGLCIACGKTNGNGKTLCDPCRDKYRARDAERKFGIPKEQYASMLAGQGGVCRLCGKPPRARALNVDHDHETGAVRGLLCGTCNTGIGHLRDSPELLRAAAKYIEDARAPLPVSA